MNFNVMNNIIKNIIKNLRELTKGMTSLYADGYRQALKDLEEALEIPKIDKKYKSKI